MKSLVYDNSSPRPNEFKSAGTFSFIDAIGARPRQDLSPKKSSQHDSYQADFSQSRSPKHVSTKLRENRSIPSTIQAGLEDSLDVFQKEHLRDSHIPSHNHEHFSPVLRNSPTKLGSLGELSPSKKEQSVAQNYFGGLRIDLSPTPSEPYKHKSTLSSVNKLHSPKSSQVDTEIILQQKALEKKLDSSTKPREFNILTNERASHNSSILSGLPFGYAVRSLERNLEDVHTKPVLQFKKLDSESPTHSPLRRQESYFSAKEQINYDKKLENLGVVAGKNNFYGETEFRYANKISSQEPLSPTQLYSAKALKNLSGVKLY